MPVWAWQEKAPRKSGLTSGRRRKWRTGSSWRRSAGTRRTRRNTPGRPSLTSTTTTEKTLSLQCYWGNLNYCCSLVKRWTKELRDSHHNWFIINVLQGTLNLFWDSLTLKLMSLYDLHGKRKSATKTAFHSLNYSYCPSPDLILKIKTVLWLSNECWGWVVEWKEAVSDLDTSCIFCLSVCHEFAQSAVLSNRQSLRQ